MMMKLILSLMVSFVSVGALPAAPAPLDRMSLVSPSPPFQSWEDTSYSRFPYVVYSRGIWLSARVSEDNPFTIYISTNGINWSLAAENPPVHYFAAIDGLWAGINQNTRVIAIST